MRKSGLSILLTALFILTCIMLSACAPGVEEAELPMGEIPYRLIDPAGDEFAVLYEEEDFASWYEEHYRQQGIFDLQGDVEQYILLGAGEQPTAGYQLQNLTLTGQVDMIETRAFLKVPGQDEVVAQVLTYPHILAAIDRDQRPLVLREIKAANGDHVEYTIDSGRYAGQIDSDFIEIQITGVPEEIPPRVFKLGEEVQDHFAALGLETGDVIKFYYITDESGQDLIVYVETM